MGTGTSPFVFVHRVMQERCEQHHMDGINELVLFALQTGCFKNSICGADSGLIPSMDSYPTM